MKAGILTFHRADNYGAVLQATALQLYIQKELCPCEMIDFYPNNAIPKKPRALRKAAHRVLMFLRSDVSRKTLLRETRFERFRAEHYKLSAKAYYGDGDILPNPPDYDVYISGSDQILNTELTGNSKAFYLDFETGMRKISYASSFGRSALPESEESLIRRTLPRFERFSIRESDGADTVERLTGMRPITVADPVLLFGRESWEGFAKLPKGLPPKYVFAYSMESSSVLEAAAEALSKSEGLPIISIRGGGKGCRVPGAEIRDCGPSEFLGVLSRAEYVVTNSFHGAVFAMIFGRKLISVAHGKRNSRLETLLREAGVLEKQMGESSSVTVQKAIIDGAEAYPALGSLIARSKEYLSEALKPEEID